jgi:hypothetical protein
MDLRFNSLETTWTYVAACFALVAIVYTASMPRHSAAVAEPINEATSVAEAAAGITFKIVPSEATGKRVSWAPLTGDGSN